MPPPTPSLPTQRPQPWPASARGWVVGYGVLGLGAFLLPTGPRALAINVLNTLAFAHAGGLMLIRSGREKEAGAGWRLFALGLFAQSLNQAWASLYMVRHGVPPAFPGLGDLLSLGSLGLSAAALLSWPLASPSGSERLRKGLDGLGAGCSAFFISWYFALSPLFHRSDSSGTERAAQVAFFLANATILGICAYLAARQSSRLRGPLGWVAAGFSVSLLEVTLQVPLALSGSYHLGHPLDLMVLLAVLLILLAPLARRPLEPGPRPGAEIQDASLPALVLPMLPAFTALTFILATLALAPARLDGPLLALAVVLSGLGLVRGMFALRDLQRLSSALETRVLERTRSLEEVQLAMLRTERMNAMAVLGAGMAHDLNNALATVRSRAELALMKAGNGLPPESRDLEHILVAADQSAALTRRLMNFGRTEEGPQAPLCLREELIHLETILRMLLGRQIALRLELGEASVPVLGSRAQIEQIFVNLVANARDAMPEGGTITIRLSQATTAGRAVARVEVEDTGEGMTPEVQARIFSPFFTTKAPGRGTGLGLASVRQLMQDLNGTLVVASQPGAGSQFVLQIPLCTA